MSRVRVPSAPFPKTHAAFSSLKPSAEHARWPSEHARRQAALYGIETQFSSAWCAAPSIVPGLNTTPYFSIWRCSSCSPAAPNRLEYFQMPPLTRSNFDISSASDFNCVFMTVFPFMVCPYKVDGPAGTERAATPAAMRSQARCLTDRHQLVRGKTHLLQRMTNNANETLAAVRIILESRRLMANIK